MNSTYYRVIAFLGAFYMPVMLLIFGQKLYDKSPLMMLLLISIFFLPLFLGGFIAYRLGRSPLPWAFACFLYGIPLLILAILGPKSERGNMICPYCGSNLIERPIFGGNELLGAPKRDILQLRKFCRCKDCNQFFEPPFPQFLVIVLTFGYLIAHIVVIGLLVYNIHTHITSLRPVLWGLGIVFLLSLSTWGKTFRAVYGDSRNFTGGSDVAQRSSSMLFARVLFTAFCSLVPMSVVVMTLLSKIQVSRGEQIAWIVFLILLWMTLGIVLRNTKAIFSAGYIRVCPAGVYGRTAGCFTLLSLGLDYETLEFQIPWEKMRRCYSWADRQEGIDISHSIVIETTEIASIPISTFQFMEHLSHIQRAIINASLRFHPQEIAAENADDHSEIAVEKRPLGEAASQKAKASDQKVMLDVATRCVWRPLARTAFGLSFMALPILGFLYARPFKEFAVLAGFVIVTLCGYFGLCFAIETIMILLFKDCYLRVGHQGIAFRLPNTKIGPMIFTLGFYPQMEEKVYAWTDIKSWYVEEKNHDFVLLLSDGSKCYLDTVCFGESVYQIVANIQYVATQLGLHSGVNLQPETSAKEIDS